MCALPNDTQIQLPADDPAVQAVSARYGASDAGPYRLKVRAASRGLRVVAVWQVLGCEARHVTHIRIRLDHRHGFEEMTLWYAAASADVLAQTVTRLIALPWVLDACFYP
ncbi:hypothetical protein [Paraburkholderia aspalathi]|uniref:Uncharacterized protein n=1 Tax=Paraburkholderia aspalathi TaxID=1324617 RepID=A0A1I7EJE8_9BURK|nr:hypothetical protein [Paraburkholderia aspalathi]SFU24005.1 hypothetical protein SAMN05192563_102475 [Paraburkholderia aspalathi]